MKFSPLFFFPSAILLLVPCAAKAAASAVLRYPAPTAVTLNTVSWSGSRFVAAGENGVILTSATGESWQVQNAPIVRQWLCGASGGGRTMLAGDRGGMVESTDGGITWSVLIPPTNPDSPGVIRYTTFHHALFDSGKFFFSSRSTNDTWVSSTPGQCSRFTAPLPHNMLLGLSSGPSEVVCSSGERSTLLHFTGSGWDPVDMAPSSPRMGRLVWTGVRYIGLGGGNANTSADGITWTPRPTGVSSGMADILWTGSQAVIVGEGGLILTSPEGAVWTKQNSGTTRNLKAAAWSGTTLTAVGETGVILTSPDGIVWTKRNESEPSMAVGGVTWLPTGGYAFPFAESFPFTGNGSLRSTDGINWMRASSGPQAPIAPVLQAATNGSRVAVATLAGLWHGTADGSSWTLLNTAATGLAWDGQRFWAPIIFKSWEGALSCDGLGFATSTDGLAWEGLRPAECSPLDWNTGLPLGAIVWTGQRVVRNGYSSDGVTSWQPVTGTQGYGNYLLWTGSEVLAVGGNGQVCSSPTGEHWTEKTPPQPPFFQSSFGTLSGAVWAGTRLVASERLPNSISIGVRDWTPAGGWRVISDIAADSVAWTGSHLIVTAANGIYTLEEQPVLHLTWESWKALRFPGVNDPAIIGAEADPDGDGWANLIEYAAGSLPVSKSSQPSARVIAGNGSPVFEWKTETAHAGVLLQAQAGNNLTTWDDVGGTILNTDGTVVTKQAGAPATGRYFFRLKATLVN